MSNDKTKHTFTKHDLAQAFTEWDRRYREEPERFQSEAVHLIRGTPETYGEWCAPYFLKILCAAENEHADDDKSVKPPR